MSGAQHDNIANRRETRHLMISPMEVLRRELFELVPFRPPRDSHAKALRFRIVKVPNPKLKTGLMTSLLLRLGRGVSGSMPREAVRALRHPFHHP